MNQAIKIKDDCILINIRVTPKSKQNKIIGFKSDVLKVQVTEAPEKGKANAAVIKILSENLKISKSSIEIVSGLTSKNKLLKLPLNTDLSVLFP